MTISNRRTRRATILAAAAAAAALGVPAVMASPASAAPSPSASVANDTLTVTGTNASELLALRLQAGAPGTLQVDFGDDGVAEQSFDRATFSRIEVFLRGGDDQFRMDQTNGAFADEAAMIDGGNGNDSLIGGDNVEVLVGGNGDDFIDGNRGNDTAYMGSGQDTFRWDPGDGSDIVEGQNGTDTLQFNGNGADEAMSLTPNGSRAVFLRNVANIRMDMNGVERLDLAAFGGADTVTVDDMSGTDFRRADIDLGGADGKADVVTVNGSAGPDHVRAVTEGARVDVRGLTPQVRLTGTELADQLRISTLGGNDAVKVDGTVFGLISPVVDLGADQA
jgi:RTX calcium-binding nonapeptide repeat (4 copies)